jgi:Transcriptional regulator/sugar kinase
VPGANYNTNPVQNGKKDGETGSYLLIYLINDNIFVAIYLRMGTLKDFFTTLRSEDMDGVAYRNLQLKKKILSYFAYESDATIPDLSKVFNISVPKMNELISELMATGLVKDYGKISTALGRRPNLYGLAADSAFFVGVEVKNNHVNIGMVDFKNNLIKTSLMIPYSLKNSLSSLNALCDIIQTFIKEQKKYARKILGIGINLSGRINFKTGYSYSYFNFDEEPLSSVIEKKLGILTYLENDSRAMAYGEFCSGVVTNEKNVLFINFDYGIGLGVMINGELYYGKSGFAGEFGHIPFFQNELICHCGKKGCLETEASGKALREQFIQKIKEGANSSLTARYKTPDEITLEDILQAATKDDTLAIELIGKISEKLGKGIAVLINLYNPELIILGGSIAQTGDYVFYPIKTAIQKYSLSIVNSDTQLKISKLGEMAGIVGACLLVRNNFLK